MGCNLCVAVFWNYIGSIWRRPIFQVNWTYAVLSRNFLVINKYLKRCSSRVINKIIDEIWGQIGCAIIAAFYRNVINSSTGRVVQISINLLLRPENQNILVISRRNPLKSFEIIEMNIKILQNLHSIFFIYLKSSPRCISSIFFRKGKWSRDRNKDSIQSWIFIFLIWYHFHKFDF